MPNSTKISEETRIFSIRRYRVGRGNDFQMFEEFLRERWNHLAQECRTWIGNQGSKAVALGLPERRAFSSLFFFL